MEVKGGLIGYGLTEDGNRGFYRMDSFDKRERVKDPFMQADENVRAISAYLGEKGIFNVYAGWMACFPEYVFEGESTEIQDLWHLGTDKPLPETIIDTLRMQIALFSEKQALKNVALTVQWKTLEKEEIHRIAELLKPEIEPRIYQTMDALNKEEFLRRLQEGIHILSGLDENRRVMVQAPPGIEKTIYASVLFIHRIKKGKKVFTNAGETFVDDFKSITKIHRSNKRKDVAYGRCAQ